MSAFYLLLPFLDAGQLMSPSVPYATATDPQQRIKVLMCPADSTTGINVTGATLAPGSYALNKAIFRGWSITGQATVQVTTLNAMEAPSMTIIAGERLYACSQSAGSYTAQTQWPDPNNSLFMPPSIDPNNGTPLSGQAPTAMNVQTNASAANCQPMSYLLQSGHPAQVNVLCGDGHVTGIPASFDGKSLDYYCLGLSKETWVVTFQPVPLP